MGEVRDKLIRASKNNGNNLLGMTVKITFRKDVSRVGQAGSFSFIRLNANNIVHLLRQYKHAFYAIPFVVFALLLGYMGTNKSVFSSYSRYTGSFILCLCIEGGLT
jgi:hypothetical protein